MSITPPAPGRLSGPAPAGLAMLALLEQHPGANGTERAAGLAVAILTDAGQGPVPVPRLAAVVGVTEPTLRRTDHRGGIEHMMRVGLLRRDLGDVIGLGPRVLDQLLAEGGADR